MQQQSGYLTGDNLCPEDSQWLFLHKQPSAKVIPAKQESLTEIPWSCHLFHDTRGKMGEMNISLRHTFICTSTKLMTGNYTSLCTLTKLMAGNYTFICALMKLMTSNYTFKN